MNLIKLKNIIQSYKGRLDLLKIDKQNKLFAIDSLNERLKTVELAQVFLQNIAQKTQEQLKYQIEDIVNLALETCFPNEYIFKLNFEISRGKTEAKLTFQSYKTGGDIDPINASGGGVLDLTCFALRLACYVLEHNTNNVIIFDEPFRFLSKDIRQSASEIVKKLSDRLGVQIIMVTHLSEMVDIADRVFEVKKNSDGVSEIKVRWYGEINN